MVMAGRTWWWPTHVIQRTHREDRQRRRYLRGAIHVSHFAGSLPVAIADLNGDGRPDVVTADRGSNTAGVRLGIGNGTLASRVDVAVGASPYGVAIADLNADGKPDLATANAGAGTVSVLLGHGDGTFDTRSDFTVGNSPRTVVIADLNADGRPDLTTSNAGSNTVSVLLGNGDGQLRRRYRILQRDHIHTTSRSRI